MRSAAAFLFVVLAPLTALASYVSETAGFDSTQQTPSNPRTGSVNDGLAASLDLNDKWSLELDLAGTHDEVTKAVAGSNMRANGGNVFAGALEADFAPTSKWFFDASINFSPATMVQSTTTVAFTPNGGNDQGQEVDADGLINARSSSVGGAVIASWDNGGNPWDTNVIGVIKASHLSTTQALAALATPRGPVDLAELRAYCAGGGAGKPVCRRLGKSLRLLPAQLDEMSIGFVLDETIATNNDLALSGDYYLYSQDPTEVGYFSIASVGRSATVGNGVLLAPQVWDASLSYTRTLGIFEVGLGLGYGPYCGGGAARSLTLKAGWHITKRWKLDGSALLDSDIDTDGSTVGSFTGALGIKYKWGSDVDS